MNALLIRTRAIDGGNGHVEALASWLLRLAHANGYKSVGALCTGERLNIKQRGAFDVDVCDETLATVASLILTEADSLERMTLRDPLSVLTGSASGGRGTGGAKGRWLLKTPLGVHGARYSLCCACLAGDAAPFLRVHWRFSTSCWCQSHRCELLDACPNCGAALLVSASRSVPVSRCGACDQDFASVSHANTVVTERGKQTDAKPDSPALAQWITAELAQLAMVDLPVPVAFPHLWWDGVRILVELCSRPVLASKLLRTELSSSSQEALHHVVDRHRIDFDRQPTKVRASLLGVVTELTENWPRRFIDLLGQAAITRSHFAMTALTTPSWLAKARDEHLCRKKYVTTPGEARTAIALLRRDSATVSKRAAKTLLGITESKALDAVAPMQKALTLVQLGTAIEFLDREIRSTTTAREQQTSALRDACCVAAAAWNGISFERAAKLPLAAGRAMTRAWAKHSSSSEEQAFVIEQFARWMELYLRGVRPRFERFAQPDAALFLTRFGAPYKGFGIAAIFARSLRETGVGDWGRGARLLVGTTLPEILGRAHPAQVVDP